MKGIITQRQLHGDRVPHTGRQFNRDTNTQRETDTIYHTWGMVSNIRIQPLKGHSHIDNVTYRT